MHSLGQHSTTGWSEHRAFHQSTQYHMAVRASCIPPVHTVPHGGQITVHSTSPHSTTWRSDQRAFHQSTQYHMAGRSSCIPPVHTVPHGGQIIVHSTSPRNMTWCSVRRLVRKETGPGTRQGIRCVFVFEVRRENKWPVGPLQRALSIGDCFIPESGLD